MDDFVIIGSPKAPRTPPNSPVATPITPGPDNMGARRFDCFYDFIQKVLTCFYF